DRYNRQGVTFVFDAREKTLRYDGEGWQELVHRYPRSPQAAEARKRLAAANRQSMGPGCTRISSDQNKGSGQLKISLIRVHPRKSAVSLSPQSKQFCAWACEGRKIPAAP